MKKFYILLGIIALLMNCQGKKTETDSSQQSEPEMTIPKADMHTAKNSLDYMGIYTGVLPTASGSGMKIEIVLADSTYRKSVVYLEKDTAAFVSEGKYSWDPNGTVITLEGEEMPNKYFVGENTLFHLDMEGNKITGDLADQYKLKKMEL